MNAGRPGRVKARNLASQLRSRVKLRQGMEEASIAVAAAVVGVHVAVAEVGSAGQEGALAQGMPAGQVNGQPEQVSATEGMP